MKNNYAGGNLPFDIVFLRPVDVSLDAFDTETVKRDHSV